MLRKWLENEVYAGHILCQKHYRPKIGDNTTRPNDGHLPMYFVRNNHEPIIDQATFDAVQAELGKRRATGGRGCTPTGGTGALTHKIICSVCGKKYHRRTRRRKTTSYKFWWCETATKGNGNPCQASQLRERAIQHACQQALGLDAWDEDTVLETITHIIASPNRELTIETRDGNQRTINLDDIDTMKGDNHG